MSAPSPPRPAPRPLLPLWAAVLTAAVANISNQWTLLGAQLFFYARVAHAITYLAGWPIIRPLFWLAGVVACALILLALFGILV